LFGPSTVGKSFVACDVAFSVGRGVPWFGWKTRRCDVLYLSLEGQWGLQNRLRAWQKRNNSSIPNNVTFGIDRFNLLNPHDVSSLIDAAPQQSLLIIDTLARASVGSDENSTRDMSLIVESAEKIQNALSCLVLIISHTGKDVSRGLRGSSALFAAIDSAIEIIRKGDERIIKIAKSKDAGDGIQKYFKLQQVNLGKDAEDDEITSCVVVQIENQTETKKLSPSQCYALESLHKALNQAEEDKIHVDTWKGFFFTGHVSDSEDSKRKAFYRARRELVALGRVTVADDFYGLAGEEALCKEGKKSDPFDFNTY
jgi:RecA-family ATPase